MIDILRDIALLIIIVSALIGIGTLLMMAFGFELVVIAFLSTTLALWIVMVIITRRW